MPAMRTLFELKTALPEAPSLNVIVEEAVAASVRPGDRVRLSGSLLPPRRVRNPGERIRHGSRPYFYVPAGDLVLFVRPDVEAQENKARLTGGLFYWEGSVTLYDARDAPAGQGYVELTGYGENNRPPI